VSREELIDLALELNAKKQYSEEELLTRPSFASLRSASRSPEHQKAVFRRGEVMRG